MNNKGTLESYTATGVEGTAGYLFYCPGCKFPHSINVTQSERPRWDFNGDEERPTFTPSILVFGSDATKRCHSFVRDGQIQFLDDCFHEFKGTTVDLPPFTW